MYRLIHGLSRSPMSLAAGLMVIFGLVAVSGCKQEEPETPQTEQATVSGSVTNDGKPLAVDSSVVFFSPESAATAAGKLDALGNFSLQAADPAIGIPAGRYQVMIRPPDEAPVEVDSDAYREMMTRGGVSTTPAPRQSDIPVKFQAFDTSNLVLEVKAGPNTFDIDLAKLAG